MTAHVKSLGFESHNSGKKYPIRSIKQHIKYIERKRKHHRNEPELFTKDQDKIHRQDFYEKLSEQPTRGVVAHKLVITLNEEERDRGNIDLMELTRETLKSFEKQNKQQLDWVGAIHDNEGHPHAHVVIRGFNEKGKQVGMYPKHLKQLQKIAEKERERLQERHLERGMDEKNIDLFQELEQEKNLDLSITRDRELERER